MGSLLDSGQAWPSVLFSCFPVLQD